MARMTIVSRKVKTVEAEMTTESAVFTTTHMLACAVDAPMLCDAKPITIQPVPQLLHMHNQSSNMHNICSLHLPC